jgi:hypothetical protein
MAQWTNPDNVSVPSRTFRIEVISFWFILIVVLLTMYSLNTYQLYKYFYTEELFSIMKKKKKLFSAFGEIGEYADDHYQD